MIANLGGAAMEARSYILMLCLYSLLTVSCTRAQIINCDFEDDSDPLCGFTNVDTDDANFQRMTGASSGLFDPSPTFDHTYMNDTGHFLDTDAARFTPSGSSVAKVYSPVAAVPSGTTKVCLQFYYHMFGPALDSLHVYKKIGSVETSIFNVSGNVGDFWKEAEVNITVQPGNIQLIFEATIGWGVRGDIALDDIKLSLTECSRVTTPSPLTTPPPLASYDCTFDDPSDGQCTPKNNSRNDFDWLFGSSGSTPNNQAPVDDHTTSTSAGMYLYVPQDSSQVEDEVLGEFRTPLLQATVEPKCLQFYYYMRGDQVGTLNAYYAQDGFPPPVVMPWNRTGEQEGYWVRGLLNINPIFANYRIAFEANRRRGYSGCIAIDDLKLIDGRCPTDELKCNFESLDICYFTQDRTDDINWLRGRGAVSYYGTGPSFDHTYQNSTGFYMYIRTTYYSVIGGHVARLISPPITETHGHAHCLIFYYHMYGRHVETLNVLIANSTTPTQRKPIWSLSGNRGDKWRGAEVHVQNSEDFMIIFEGVRDSYYQGDIAIDDVWITSTEGCPGEVGLKNFSSITCDFEEIEICYWMQDTTDDFDWTWQNGASQQLTNTGPSEDHTTGLPLGFYMFIQEDYTTVPGGEARLISPEAKVQPAPSCLEFWYHMYGRDIESLSVYMMKSGATDLPSDPVWTMSGDQGDYWHRGTVDIESTDYTFRFVFVGTRGQSYRDNIAFDDVKFYKGESCPAFTTDAPIPTTTPVPIEAVSANCDFEDVNDTMCGYTQSIDDEFDWSVRSGYPIRNDNTLGRSQGHYLYLEKTYYLRQNDRADIYSPLLMKSDQPQCLEFYYFMSGYNVDFLLVYFTRWGTTLAIDPDFSIYGDQGYQWNVARVNIPAMDTNFQVVFEGLYTYVYGYYRSVAIDDIKFFNGSCQMDVTTPASHPLDGRCDFELGFDACGYTHDRSIYNVGNSDFYWLRNSGATASKGTGPKVDHTIGTEKGYYMYIEASLPQRPNDRAFISSPMLYSARGAPLCMVFYYHMNGADVGQINVYWQTNTASKKLLTLIGNSMDVWQPAAVDLTNVGEQFKVTFEGVVGYGVAGDMAIDDISLRNQPCPGFAKSVEADFEMPGDLNGFTQYWTGDTYWQWYDHYESHATLPEGMDKGDGSFMYIDGTMFEPDSQATLVSPVMAGLALEHCLGFDYAIFNDETGALLVTIRQKNGTIQDLMTKDGLTAWTHEWWTLSKAEVGEEFMILVTGQAGKQRTGYVAVDNLVIREHSCGDLVEPPSSVGYPVPSMWTTETSKTSAQTASGVSVTATVLLAILLAVALTIIVIGAAFYVRRRRMAKSVSSVVYNRGLEDGNDNEGSLAYDLSISNPNYPTASLQSNV